MRIGDICTRRVIQIDPGTSLLEAANTMRRQQVGALVVTEQRDNLPSPIGIVTDRDIVVAVIAAGVNPQSLAVCEVMARSLATCGERDELFDVIELMRKRGIRRLPVVDAAGALIGMITADDIVGAVAEHLSELAKALVSEESMEMHRYRASETDETACANAS